MHLRTCFAAAALALSCAVCSTLPAATVQFLGEYNDGTTPSSWPYGPYAATIDGTDAIVYCNDKANQVSVGQSWEATLTPLSLDADLSNTRYGALPNANIRYLQAAWLTTQYAGNPDAAEDIQSAIWRVFIRDPLGFSIDPWRILAKENYATIKPNRFSIVTNAGPVRPTGQVQEFITLTPVVSDTPEPGTFVLVGGVLIAAARKRLMRFCKH